MIELIHQRQRGQSRQDYSKRPGKLQHWISVHHAGAPNHQPCRNRRFAHGLKEQSLKPHFWLIEVPDSVRQIEDCMCHRNDLNVTSLAFDSGLNAGF